MMVVVAKCLCSNEILISSASLHIRKIWLVHTQEFVRDERIVALSESSHGATTQHFSKLAANL